MMRPVCYPPCEWLDPDQRDASGRFWCVWRGAYVAPARTVYTAERRTHLFRKDRYAPDCWHCNGKTPRATMPG